MLKYPIGIQDFRTLREGGYVYVDKTEHIHRLLTTGKYYFFSRPRRFGKSLTVATMNELYSGSRELFEELWVQDHWDFEAMRRPVVWLKLARLDYHEKGLSKALLDELHRIARIYDLTLPEGTLKESFDELLRRLSQQHGRVVLLVDEYDKPIIDYLGDLPRAEDNRDLMKRFYSVLKDADPYLELVFITGVSAFSRVSIFSDLNNISNISLDASANALTGITQAEVNHYFGTELAAEEESAVVRRWYNGYSWTGEQTVYNPFSLLSYLRSGDLKNYWFETGTPTFLIKIIQDLNLYNIHRPVVSESELIQFDLADLPPIGLLFQTGYLTIVERNNIIRTYTLDYPNLEVKQSFEEVLLTAYQRTGSRGSRARVIEVYTALQSGDVQSVIFTVNAVLASVPYDFWRRDDEHIFHAIVHLTFSLLGVYVQSEVHTARGRCDALVQTDDHIYAFEFKLNATAQAALDQIEARGYLTPYADDPREKIAVGISFASETRQIGEWTTATAPPQPPPP